ncbi:hypothetical protein R1flu_022066 [Riccia fluitans]|uniref:Uncharacterized protein n=1 Tax=Riccia fluitans TaxID=41844 RepID=A0ABD1ZR48_9MARC
MPGVILRTTPGASFQFSFPHTWRTKSWSSSPLNSRPLSCSGTPLTLPPGLHKQRRIWAGRRLILQSADYRQVTIKNPQIVRLVKKQLTCSASGFDTSNGSLDSAQSDGGLLDALLEPIDPRLPQNPDKLLINDDFSPALPEQRSFSVWDLASLWVGLVVGIPTYYMAGSLVEMGMAWWQGILTVLAGNLIVLIPMVLSGHGGTKYGLPFPVLSRAAFGIRGANVPSLLRALVGCGWFGIQTWIGGQAIFRLLNALVQNQVQTAVIPFIGTSFPELACFLFFWFLQVCIIWNGIESIREMEKLCAPVLIGLSASLLAWAVFRAGGFGPMLSAPSQFVAGGPKEGQFWAVFFPALTANVGFWATLSLNIPDFTRYARNQSDQLVGQALGLPLFMAAFTFVGLAVTSATVVVFGRAISDPIAVLSLIGSAVPTLLSLVGVILATITTNIAANVVAPANALVNVNPSFFSFRKAGLITATLSILLAPWRLIQSTQGFIYTWLIGYSALLGPVGGIVITDYFLIRNRSLDVTDLFSMSSEGQYWYTWGFNFRALAALVLGVLPNIPGFLHSVGFIKNVPGAFQIIYGNSWFVGFLLSSACYWVLTATAKKSAVFV